MRGGPILREVAQVFQVWQVLRWWPAVVMAGICVAIVWSGW